MIYFSWCLLLMTCLPATSDIVPSFSITDIYLQRFDGFLFFTGDSVWSRLCHAPVTCFPAFFACMLYSYTWPYFLMLFTARLLFRPRYLFGLYLVAMDKVQCSFLTQTFSRTLQNVVSSWMGNKIASDFSVSRSLSTKVNRFKKYNWRVIIKELSVFYALTILI